MMDAKFVSSAIFVVTRNLTPNVCAVSLAFEGGHMSLTYHVRDVPTDDDEDELELSCGEIAAEFPSVRSAETHLERFEEATKPARNEIIVWPEREYGEATTK